jgi:hypothetical protein
MKDWQHSRHALAGTSFSDRHPILAGAVLVLWVLIAGIPVVAMMSKPVACAIGAAETWCPEAEGR